MANLSYERLTEAPPFTYCSVDIFGPFHIRERDQRSRDMEQCLHALQVELFT